MLGLNRDKFGHVSTGYRLLIKDLILDITCFNGILKMDGFILKYESNWNLIVSL